MHILHTHYIIVCFLSHQMTRCRHMKRSYSQNKSARGFDRRGMLCLLIHRSLSLILFIFVTENRELCHSFHYHSYIRKSLNHFHSCLSKDKKKLFRALNLPRTSSGRPQRNNQLLRSNPRTKKGGTRFHICILQGNASLILIPRRMLILYQRLLFVNKRAAPKLMLQ